MKRFKSIFAFLLCITMLLLTIGCNNKDGDHKHKGVHRSAIESTCTSLGKVEHQQCVICDKLFADEDCTEEIDTLGGTFDRPAFNEMIKDMKRKKFDIILIKDFSRLGRVMHKVGDFVENIFPSYNIRLISVSDNYDSLTSVDDDSVVLRYFINEFYLKDFKKNVVRLEGIMRLLNT